jgi:hypothetical protein
MVLIKIVYGIMLRLIVIIIIIKMNVKLIFLTIIVFFNTLKLTVITEIKYKKNISNLNGSNKNYKK